MSKPSIAAICTSCKTTYKLGTRSCPRCNKVLSHLKGRIKTPYGWLTRQSADLGEIQTFIQEVSIRAVRIRFWNTSKWLHYGDHLQTKLIIWTRLHNHLRNKQLDFAGSLM